ncbi:MAG: DUF6440 family protein [Erysipelotrichaceae bacterium]|jgi:hypothetical protein
MITKKTKRFKKVYSQGGMKTKEIWVDMETGVNYLYHESGYSSGVTPLLDKNGLPFISPIEKTED